MNGREFAHYTVFRRYETVRRILLAYKEKYGLASLSILEVGSSGDCLIDQFLPDEAILHSDIDLPANAGSEKEIVRLDAADMPAVKDSSFDFVVACDVYEHIPASRRESFLKETYRAAKRGVVFCFPFASDGSRTAESWADTYHELITGRPHKWIHEHIQIGLPDKDSVNGILEANAIPYASLEHGGFQVSEAMHEMSVLHYEMENKTKKLFRHISKYYADRVYIHDVSDENYRVFYILAKNKDDGAFFQSVCGGLFIKRDKPVGGDIHLAAVLRNFHQSYLLHVGNDAKDQLNQQRSRTEGLRAQLRLIQSQLEASRSETERTRTRLRESQSQLEASRSETERTRTRLCESQSRLEASRSETERTRTRLCESQSRLEASRAEAEQTREQLNLLRNSTIWRSTKPVRSLLNFIRKMAGHKG